MKKQIVFWMVLFLAMTVLGEFAISAIAGPGKIRPYVQVRHEYSDNIFFSSSDEKEDMLTTTTAGTILEYIGERTQTRLDGSLLRLFYWDNDQLNDTNAAITSSINHQATERVGIGATASFKKNSKKGSETEETGLSVSGDTETKNVGVSSSFSLSETLSLQMSAGYGMVDTDEIESMEEDTSIRAEISLNKDLSRTFANTTGFITLNYLKYTSEQESIPLGAFLDTLQDVESDVFQLYVGFSKNITELYSVYFQAGASYTNTAEEQYLRSRFTGVTVPFGQEVSSDSVGAVFAAGINYDGLYWDFGLDLSHDVKGATGSSGTVERSSVKADISRQITENLSCYLNSSVFLNRNKREQQADTDQLTFNIEPGFRYRVLDTWAVTLAGRFITSENRQTDSSNEKTMAYIMIRKTFDL